MRFHLDDTALLGASHYTKLIVVDDAVAFCGGADLSDTRWDTPGHLHEDRLRSDPSGSPYPPRHSITCVVDGAAARALGDLARERWRLATGEAAPSADLPDAALWPPGMDADLGDAKVTILRTRAGGRDWPEQRENGTFTREAIAAARTFIYAEKELIAAPAVRDAVAARLREPQGPEIVLITGARADPAQPSQHRSCARPDDPHPRRRTAAFACSRPTRRAGDRSSSTPR